MHSSTKPKPPPFADKVWVDGHCYKGPREAVDARAQLRKGLWDADGTPQPLSLETVCELRDKAFALDDCIHLGNALALD